MRRRAQVRLPAPPAVLSPRARAEWRRVARVLAEKGLLTPLDAGILAAYCQSYAWWQDVVTLLHHVTALTVIPTDADGLPDPARARVSPLLEIARNAQSDFLRLAHALGMTPASQGTPRSVGLQAKFPGWDASASAGAGAGAGAGYTRIYEIVDTDGRTVERAG